MLNTPGVCQAWSTGRQAPRLQPLGLHGRGHLFSKAREPGPASGACSSLGPMTATREAPGPPPFTGCSTGAAPTLVPVAAPAPATAPATAVAAAATTTVVRAAIFPLRAARAAAATQAWGFGPQRLWERFPKRLGSAGLQRTAGMRGGAGAWGGA